VNFSSEKISIYLTSQVLASFFAFFLIISLIISGNQLFLVVSQSLKEGLFDSEIFSLITLKYLRDSSFVVSLSFVLALVYSLNKLYRNSEMLILSNAGLGDYGIFKKLFSMVFFISLFVSFLSFFVSPTAINRINFLKETAQNRPDFIFLKEGIFQNFNNNIIFFASNVSFEDEKQILRDVFLFQEEGNKLILSKNGEKFIDPNNRVYLKLLNGKIYQNLLSANEANFSVSNFNELTFLLFKPKEIYTSNMDNSYESKGFGELISEFNIVSLNEVFYRLSIPLSLLIMSYFSVQISRSNPRTSKNLQLGYVLIGYIFYYNMIIFNKQTFFLDLDELLLTTISPHFLYLLLIFYVSYVRNGNLRKSN